MDVIIVLLTILFAYCSIKLINIGKRDFNDREVARTRKWLNDKYSEVFDSLISSESKNMYVKSVIKLVGNQKKKAGFFYDVELIEKLDACLSIVNGTPYIIDIEFGSNTFAILIDHDPKLIKDALNDNLIKFESDIDSTIQDYFYDFFTDKYDDRYGHLDSFDDMVDKSADPQITIWKNKSITSKLNFIIKNRYAMETLSYVIEDCIKTPITVEYIQLIIKGLIVDFSMNDNTNFISDSL